MVEPGQLSRRQEYAEATAHAILHAAGECFLSVGYRATTIDAVATAARVSKGSVYHHFEDKAALLEAVFKRQQLWLAAETTAAVMAEGRGERKVAAGVRRYLTHYVSEAGALRLRSEAMGALGPTRCAAIEADVGMRWIEHLVGASQEGQRGTTVAVRRRLLASVLLEAAALAGEGTGSIDQLSVMVEAVWMTLLDPAA